MIKPHIHVPYTRFYEYLDIIQREKLNLEIYFDAKSLDEITEKEVLKLKENLNYGPSLSFHGPFMDLSPGAVDYKIRELTIERFKQVFQIAEILKPLTIVFHSGYDKWKYAFKIDLWLKQSLITWEQILPIAEKLKIKIAIENIFEEEPQNLKTLMEKISSPYMGICFDTGHFNLFSKTELDEWISVIGEHIIEFHLHDNRGFKDEHLAIGSGCFDFKKLFKLMDGNDCLHTIEAHNPPEVFKSLEKLKELIK